MAEDGLAIGRERRGMFVEQLHVEIDHRVRQFIAQLGEDERAELELVARVVFQPQRMQIGEEGIHF